MLTSTAMATSDDKNLPDLESHLEQPSTAPDKELLGFEFHLLFKLCLYYSYGPDKIQEITALFNKNHEQRISNKQLKDAYLHMHDIKHDSYKLARDINRKNPEKLKNILKDELNYTADRLREPIIKPSKPMAAIRKSRSIKRKKKSGGGDPENSTIQGNLMVVDTPGGI
ncbi:hypothetical protein JMJ35_009845 [Cladonia borealis]|uniref:Uncharacterized protein n=1 Tax=Cladonia borealis TaxID=184061 RepID=A0AA39U527_9LECA|nr:hypothetical protein JMJ35_009845 [Cladonia borealis]